MRDASPVERRVFTGSPLRFSGRVEQMLHLAVYSVCIGATLTFWLVCVIDSVITALDERRARNGMMTLRQLEYLGKDWGVRPRRRFETYASYRRVVTTAKNPPKQPHAGPRDN